MNSDMFKLKATDFAKGAAMAVIAAIVVVLYGVTQAPDFNIVNVNWTSVATSAESAAAAAFVSYVVKNFFSDSSGKLFGKIG